MKVVILAGGFGTRMGELTKDIPKPMIPINHKPIIHHLMDYYHSFGFSDFIILTGYKGYKIREYFDAILNSGMEYSYDFSSGTKSIRPIARNKYTVSILDSGVSAMTAGRLLSCQHLLSNEEQFLLTYGDGLSNVDLRAVINTRQSNHSIATITAVRPLARFGEVLFKEGSNILSSFQEKPQGSQGWINGGFMCLTPLIYQYINSLTDNLEYDILPLLASEGLLSAYQHNGFWQCIDTPRDILSAQKFVH